MSVGLLMGAGVNIQHMSGEIIGVLPGHHRVKVTCFFGGSGNSVA